MMRSFVAFRLWHSYYWNKLHYLKLVVLCSLMFLTEVDSFSLHQNYYTRTSFYHTLCSWNYGLPFWSFVCISFCIKNLHNVLCRIENLYEKYPTWKLDYLLTCLRFPERWLQITLEHSVLRNCYYHFCKIVLYLRG